ncbi:MAG: hypothetical protein JWO99_710 [Candidatus Saccharibacteria bacterium]|nr:hypothetical protein [Candidatus Saccharibacteria bacterium]
MSETGKVLPAATGPTAAGAILLPNTGDNHVLFFVALVTVVIGSAIILSTLVRLAAKKFYKA